MLQPLIVDEFEEDDIVFQGIEPPDKVVADIYDAKGQAGGPVNAARLRFGLDFQRGIIDSAFFGNSQRKIKQAPILSKTS